jgi:hypothetical protein
MLDILKYGYNYRERGQVKRGRPEVQFFEVYKK